ncbi:MAG TPA: DUF4189 domain-containing protein [Lacipirellulaceae bacterium]|nr:DUF4189 domain-containing protein [Lacipirellulaceae bacterium]
MRACHVWGCCWLACGVLAAALSAEAGAQGYFASIAYSQSTGRVGYSAAQSRTQEGADALAIRMCASEDAKVWMWARDQWVAIAVVEGHKGNAGFGRGDTSQEAQQRALEECGKRAQGRAHRVVLCVHSGGSRVRDEDLRRVAAKPITSRTGYFAAIAYSRSTGKIGSTAGKAKTIEEAQKLALAACEEKDAKVYMWGDQWIAVAVAPTKPGIAGFSPGDTREAAEKGALQQCEKHAGGAPCRVELVLYSTGEEEPAVIQASAAEAAPAPKSPPEPPPEPPAAK